MNKLLAFLKNTFTILFLTVFSILALANYSSAQITPVLGDAAKYIYGLSDYGEIFEIDVSTGTTNKTIKDATYTGNPVALPNGLGYSAVTGKFYYFKRNYDFPSQEFVSFDPKTGLVSVLAKSSITIKTVTGCVSYDGTGYYTMTANGTLNYYDILTDKWTQISGNIVDNFGNDIDSLVLNWRSGDIAIDGAGNLCLVISYSAKYSVYKITGPVPTTSVSQLTATRIVAPTTSTPNNSAIAGIAFNAKNEIFMSTIEDKLYLFQNNSSLTYIANLPEATEGTDLASQVFPIAASLPVTWISVDASVSNSNNVTLSWKVIEYENKGFYIEHSVDGSTWSDLAFIKSRNISQSEQIYSYSYTASLSGRQYYRIRQLDIDGKESFSSIKVLNFGINNSTIAVWPNPARNNIYIDNKSGNHEVATRIQLYDLSGKLTIDKKLQQGINIIDINSIPSGTYIVTMITGNGNLFTRKIVKR